VKNVNDNWKTEMTHTVTTQYKDSIEYLLETWLRFDPVGNRAFTWKVSPAPRIKVGTSAGGWSPTSKDIVIGINGRVYRQAEVLLIMYSIHHPSGDPKTHYGVYVNAKSNDFSATNLSWMLREHQFQGKPKTSSKYKGVYKTAGGKFYATISRNKVHYNQGTFATEEEAARAYDIAKKGFHPTAPKESYNFPEDVDKIGV
jgi:AP2 domain